MSRDKQPDASRRKVMTTGGNGRRARRRGRSRALVRPADDAVAAPKKGPGRRRRVRRLPAVRTRPALLPDDARLTVVRRDVPRTTESPRYPRCC